MSDIASVKTDLAHLTKQVDTVVKQHTSVNVKQLASNNATVQAASKPLGTAWPGMGIRQVSLMTRNQRPSQRRITLPLALLI